MAKKEAEPETDETAKPQAEGAPEPEVRIAFGQIREDELGPAPERQYPNDAGLDLVCTRYVLVSAGAKAQVAHNIAVAIPSGYFGLIVPRSSALVKKGLLVHLGVIDPGYRGEIQTVVYNPNKKGVHVSEGERISQLLILPLVKTAFHKRDKMPSGVRGTEGFGSTGGFGEAI